MSVKEGDICSYSLHASDAKAAAAFYKKAFKWGVTTGKGKKLPEGYMAMTAGSTQFAHAQTAPKGMASQWVFHVCVAHLPAAFQRALRCGPKVTVVTPPTEIGGKGAFFIVSIAGLHVGVTTWGAMPPQPTPAEGFIYHEGKTSRDDFTFVVACLTSICSWKAVDYPQPNGKSLYCKFFRTPFRDDEASSIVNGAVPVNVGLSGMSKVAKKNRVWTCYLGGADMTKTLAGVAKNGGAAVGKVTAVPGGKVSLATGSAGESLGFQVRDATPAHKAPAKKSAAKKTPVKKAAKKTPTKKTAKKTPTKKAAAPKKAGKAKTPTKKATPAKAKKTPAKKTSAKAKTPVKKTPKKKAAAKPAAKKAAKKAGAKKTAAKK